jgi:hypothetical protein
MRIRHITDQHNVDADGILIDPLRVRHGVVVGARIAALAGAIDPHTHLNLGFPLHTLDDCLVAEALCEGAALLRDGDRFRVAVAHPAAYSDYGTVDTAARQIAWRRALTERLHD